MHKRRLSASVSADLVRAAEQAVVDGRAESVSAWVDTAMRRQLEHDERLRALGEFISAWEAEHGEITEEELRAATRRARRRATVVRGGVRPKAPKVARQAPRRSSQALTSRKSA